MTWFAIEDALAITRNAIASIPVTYTNCLGSVRRKVFVKNCPNGEEQSFPDGLLPTRKAKLTRLPQLQDGLNDHACDNHE